MSSSERSDPESGAAGERRAYINLRVIFGEACRKTAPFFDARHGWGEASLVIYARQTLRDTYPDLSQQEVAILLSAVQRFHENARGK